MTRLYRKWKVFADNYLRLNMNGTRAYKVVYGDMSDDVAANCASKLLRKSQVQEYLTERFKETHMSGEEVLARYAEQAKGEHAQYLTPQGLDIKALLAAGKGHLIKKWSYSSDGKPVFEFQDAQHALDMIGKHLKLFEEPGQVINLNISGLDLLIESIYGSRNQDSDDPGG
jgi:hypothetical protein